MRKPKAWLKSATFSDNTVLSFGPKDVVVIVGPNNSGKSAALRAFNEKLQNLAHASPVVTKVEIGTEGDTQQLLEWLPRKWRVHEYGDREVVYGPSCNIRLGTAGSRWQQAPAKGLQELSGFFRTHVSTEARLSISTPPQNINILSDGYSHPVHFLFADDRLEESISGLFRQAFGDDLIVHKGAGSTIPLLVGRRPDRDPNEDRTSYSYCKKLAKLPQLSGQGDGIRAFVGVVLYARAYESQVLLIDEPEAFLHPPQARLLGQVLGRTSEQAISDSPEEGKPQEVSSETDTAPEHTPESGQLFLATHSGDFLRGLLDARNPSLRVVRVRRAGTVNRVHELRGTDIEALWKDTLLRASNVLDGLFHERVVVCEGDSDCRFYNALLDSMFDEQPNTPRADIMFTHCGGKSRIPMVVRALRTLDTPVTAVTDLDVLSDENPLRTIVEAFGAQWNDFQSDWQMVRSSIEEKKPELTTAEVKQDISEVINGITERFFPRAGTRAIQEILRRSSPWSIVKQAGLSYIPSGEARKAADRILSNLKTIGLHIVPAGEVERFVPTEGGHGPEWVNAVLKRDLAQDPELESARAFVRSLVA